MKPDAMAVEFRRRVHDEHLLLEMPVGAEERYVFELAQGPLTLPQHPEHVRRLLELAEEVYGFRQGEHAELLGLAALRDQLDDQSGSSVEIAWRPLNPAVLASAPRFWVDLQAWVDDQFLMEDALEIFPETEVA